MGKAKTVYALPNPEFSHRLWEFRRDEKMLLKVLARKAKVSTATISKLEAGDYLPTEERLRSLHAAFYHKLVPNFGEFCLLAGRLPERAKGRAIVLLLKEIREDREDGQ